MLRFRKKDSKELIKRMAKTNGCSVSEYSGSVVKTKI